MFISCHESCDEFLQRIEYRIVEVRVDLIADIVVQADDKLIFVYWACVNNEVFEIVRRVAHKLMDLRGGACEFTDRCF